MIVTVLKTTFSKSKPTEMFCRCYKTYDHENFRKDLRNALTEVSNYAEFETAYMNTLNKHAPYKKKTVRPNQAPYMTKTLRKAIMRRSALKNKLYKDYTLENDNAYRKQRNFCSKLYKKVRKRFYDKLDTNNINDNRLFWKTVKPFLSEKGTLLAKITLVESGEIISEDKIISETFNTFFADTVNKLDIQENKLLLNPTSMLIDPIDIALKKFEFHPSIMKIKEKVHKSIFSFSSASLQDIESEINNLNPQKASTSGNIPTRSLKDNIDITANILHKMFNDAVLNCEFPDKLKFADITPCHKNDDATNKKNYRPISILPIVSKLFEKLIQKQIANFINTHLYKHMYGYRKGYNTQQALISLLEKWKSMLDKQGYAGVLMMDLSKAFDTINQELLIAKLYAYGLDRKSVLLIRNYLTNRWHRTKINSSFSSWQSLINGVPQGSVLGPLLFNIYLNDLFYFIEETEASNYADDTNIHACDMNLNNLLKRLEHDALIAVEWFESNYMKINRKKCHILITGKKYEHIWLNVGSTRIWESSTEKLLGVIIDSKLKFDIHVNSLIKIAGRKLTAMSRLSRVLSFSKLRMLIKIIF